VLPIISNNTHGNLLHYTGLSSGLVHRSSFHR